MSFFFGGKINPGDEYENWRNYDDQNSQYNHQAVAPAPFKKWLKVFFQGWLGRTMYPGSYKILYFKKELFHFSLV
jgi:hypothetical protein